MNKTRAAALALVVAGTSLLPVREASAGCWHNGWGWHCGPGLGLLALPFVAAGTAVGIATAPVRAIAGAPYYGPGYYPPSAYYYPPAPGYYYYPPPMPLGGNDPSKSTNN